MGVRSRGSKSKMNYRVKSRAKAKEKQMSVKAAEALLNLRELDTASLLGQGRRTTML